MKNKWILLGILCLGSIIIMHDLVVIPIFGHIFGYFGENKAGLANLMLSGPALVNAIMSLLSGFLLAYFSKKTLIVTSFIVYTLSMILSAFDFIGPEALTIIRLIPIGLSAGIITVFGYSLIADIFTDEKERARAMGIYTSSYIFLSIFLGVASGILGQDNWRNSFNIGYAFIPICILLFFLPKTKGTLEKLNFKNLFTKEKLMLWGSYFVYEVIQDIDYYLVALIAEAKGITNTVTVGLIAAPDIIGAVIAGAIFGWMFMRIKGYSITLGYLLLAAGFISQYFVTTPIGMFCSSFMINFAHGLSLAYFMMKASQLPGNTTTNIALTNVVVGIGAFISPFLIQGAMGIFNVSIVGTLLPVAFIALIATTVSFVIHAREQRRIS